MSLIRTSHNTAIYSECNATYDLAHTLRSLLVGSLGLDHVHLQEEPLTGDCTVEVLDHVTGRCPRGLDWQWRISVVRDRLCIQSEHHAMGEVVLSVDANYVEQREAILEMLLPYRVRACQLYGSLRWLSLNPSTCDVWEPAVADPRTMYEWWCDIMSADEKINSWISHVI